MDNYEVLKRPFNIETHKKTFINYLEVVISPDGVIEYAVPSHNGKLEEILMKKLKINRQQLSNLCPVEYYCNYYGWLCKETGYIMVWGLPNSNIIGDVTEKQKQTLELLRKEELL